MSIEEVPTANHQEKQKFLHMVIFSSQNYLKKFNKEVGKGDFEVLFEKSAEINYWRVSQCDNQLVMFLCSFLLLLRIT